MKSYKGKYKPMNPKKYKGDSSQVIYRSLWERKLMVYCDKNNSVVEWGSEEIIIPYVSPKDGRVHRYFPDFYAKIKTKDGEKKFILEIKPKSLFKKRKKPKRVTKKVLREMAEIEINNNKWKAARKFCKEHNFTFEVLTDDHLKRFRI